jgi:hypothetical protein
LWLVAALACCQKSLHKAIAPRSQISMADSSTCTVLSVLYACMQLSLLVCVVAQQQAKGHCYSINNAAAQLRECEHAVLLCMLLKRLLLQGPFWACVTKPCMVQFG